MLLGVRPGRGLVALTALVASILVGLAAGSASAAQQLCPSNPSQPLIEPEALSLMNVPAAQQISKGAGIRIGIIADGVDPTNPDLIRADGRHVVFDYRDFTGFGTGAPTNAGGGFLAAGMIGSQGNQTYDLSGAVNPAHPLPPGCNVKLEGISPYSSLAALNVGGENDAFFEAEVVQAIQWAVKHDHVNVLDEPIGHNPLPDGAGDPVALANKAAVAAGVTVVTSAGDGGPFNDVESPATTPGVIAVGASTAYQLWRQTTRYGGQLATGGWEDKNVSPVSSGGISGLTPTTVNVVAPGDGAWALCSTDTSAFTGCGDIDHGTNPPPLRASSGSEAAAAATAGTAALVLTAYARTHSGAFPSPALVKEIIASTATDLGAPADHQGAGMVNALKAVQLSESVGSTTRRGETLLVDKPALAATVAAGQSSSFAVRITNEGAAAETITPTVAGPPTTPFSDTGAVTLSSASPTFVDGEGNSDSYAVHSFTVPPGADYLDGDIAWDATAGGAVFETLFDPQGGLAAYSALGGDHSGFGHVEVTHPSAGAWTSVIFTVDGSAQYSGAVQFAYSSRRFHSSASISPASLALAPGGSGTIHVTATAPAPGDESLRLHLGTTAGTDDGSIPIVLRSLVPLTSTGGRLTGSLTGGGQSGSGGQTVTYQFVVPSGEPALNVGLRLTDSGYPVQGYLVDPSGQSVDIQSTATFDASDDFLGFGSTMQFLRVHPRGGLWTLTLLVSGPLPGARLSERFGGVISFAAPKVTSTGIPATTTRKLPHGQPVTATVTVTNTGNSRKDFFIDPRLTARISEPLAGASTDAVALPLSGSPPSWLVPPDANSLTVGADGTVPITLDVSAAGGDPDGLGTSSTNAAKASLTAPELAPGVFVARPQATGPFSASGVTAGASVDLHATATANRFDSAVTSTTGDLWARSVVRSAPYTPLSLAPGATGKITLTFTPNARPGSVVNGVIGVDTFDPATFSGDEVAAVPYAYTVSSG